MSAVEKVERPQLFCIPPNETEKFMQTCYPMLERGWSATGLKAPHIGTIAKDLAEDRALLWVEATPAGKIISAMLTRVIRGKEGPLVKLGPVGGEGLDSWRDHIGLIVDYAKQRGCVGLRIEGRDGWLKALPGFERVGVILERRI